MKPNHQRTQSTYTGKTKASINRSVKQNWVNVFTPYNAKFVSELKGCMEPSYRAWNPTDKCWEVSENRIEELIDLCLRYFDSIETDLESPANLPDGGSYATLFLLPSAPNELIKSVYRFLSMLNHPDKGGTVEQMSKLNSAMDDIKKERGI